MAEDKKAAGFFQRQPIMRSVLISLVPVTLGAVFFFGLRVLLLLAVVTAAGIATETVFARKRDARVTESVLVTCLLFTLSLPVATPFWVAAVGIVFGVLFAKEVFGGFGRNVFNPAIVARTFVFISFPEALTASWSQPFTHFPGGWVRYQAPLLDSLTQATPLAAFSRMGEVLPPAQVIWGYTSGSMGETSVVLLLLGAAYMVLRKAADWRLMAAPIAGFVGLSALLNLLQVENVPHPLYGLVTGGFLFLALYFVCEPVTSPRTTEAKWVYGLLVGIITVAIRYYGIFPEGASFSLLIMNTFVPVMDEGVKTLKNSRKQVST